MTDAGVLDRKIVAVATGDPEFNGYHEASEIPSHYLLMLRRFFQDYKQLEKKVVDVEEIRPAKDAYPVIEATLKPYAAKYAGARAA
jgi:inorganic pyrophosphatase